jgi:hypothetical protein
VKGRGWFVRVKVGSPKKEKKEKKTIYINN